MENIVNLGNQCVQTLYSFYNEPLDDEDLNKIIGTIATGIFIGLIASMFGLETTISYAGNMALGMYSMEMMNRYTIEKNSNLVKGIGHIAKTILAAVIINVACYIFSAYQAYLLGVWMFTGIISVAYRRFKYIESITLYPSEIKSDFLIIDVLAKIACNLNFKDQQSFSQVSKGSHRMIFNINEQRKAAVKEIIFGKKEWHRHFNLNMGIEPPIPYNIIEILNRPCPVEPTKKIRDNYVLTLIPKNFSLKEAQHRSLNLLPFNLLGFYFINLFKNDIFNTIPRIVIPNLMMDASNTKTYWVLMKKNLIDETINKTLKEQKDELVKISEENNIHYTLPSTLEAAISIFAQTKIRKDLLGVAILTQCQEEINDNRVVAGILNDARGHQILTCFSINPGVYKNLGVCGVLRFS